MKKWLIALGLTATFLNATTIKDIRFDSLIHISPSIAKEMIGFSTGEELDIKKVDDSIKRLYNQGYFEDIWVEEQNGVITYHFSEKPLISKVIIEGLTESDTEKYYDALNLKKGATYDYKRLLSAKSRLLEAISEKGTVDSIVEVKTEKLDNGSMVVRFIVNKGEKIIIESVTFDGAKAFDRDDLENEAINRQEEFLGWLFGRNDGEMKVTELSNDPLRIRELYMKKGYLDAEVQKPYVDVDFNRYRAKIAYSISEGPEYTTKDIQINISKDGITDFTAVRKKFKLKVGEVFDIESFRSDMEKIKFDVADKGYAFTQVNPDLQKDKESGEVTVVYSVNPGEIVYINDVIISGNSRTLDRVIRREMYLVPGSLYSMTDLKDSRNALGRTGYFEDTSVEERRVSDDKIDLIVKVKEAPTGSVQVGGGYGSYGGLLISASLSDRNIFGSGINVGLQFDNSEINKRQEFSISNPRVFDSDYSGSFRIFNNEFESYDFTVAQFGGTVAGGRKFNRFLSGSLAYNYVDSQLSDLLGGTLTNSNNNIVYDNRPYQKSSISTALSFDNTDDFYIPREGYAISGSLEFAGVGGTAKYIKGVSKFNAYRGLEEWINFDAIVRYKSTLNYIEDTGFVPINEKFFSGGIGSIRGYETYSLSPIVNGSRTGGNMSFSNSAEVSIPLIPDAKLRMALFVDYGFIGEDSFDEIARGGYGVAAEWFSPMGPIQLIFAQPIGEEAADRTAAFEFTIGQRF